MLSHVNHRPLLALQGTYHPVLETCSRFPAGLEQMEVTHFLSLWTLGLLGLDHFRGI